MEQEEQKVSAFTRDDEEHQPWGADVLLGRPSGALGDEPFYPLAQFRVREEQVRPAQGSGHRAGIL